YPSGVESSGDLDDVGLSDGTNHRAILNLPRIMLGSLLSTCSCTLSKTTNDSGCWTSKRKWTSGGQGLLVSNEANTDWWSGLESPAPMAGFSIKTLCLPATSLI